MDKSITGLMGLLDNGKRIYKVQEGEVSREEFEYCVAMDYLMFGEKGYTDTLGPTWNMTLDPRFQVIENSFITEKRSVFGGDTRQGIQTQLADGTFVSGITDLEQYAEIIGEGRYFHGALRSIAYDEAIKQVFPDKTFPELIIPRQYSGTVREYREGLVHYKSLTPEEQLLVDAKVDEFEALKPVNFFKQDDELLWQLIHEHCPNYFTKSGKANPKGEQLYKLFRCDLLGLVDDYAELPKFDEWVATDGSGELADINLESSEEAPRVHGEVDLIERALTFRAELRTVAARILNLLGVGQYLQTVNLELTELERDHLVRLVFQSEVTTDADGVQVFKTKWPDGRAEMSSRIMGYLGGINAIGASFNVRQIAQLAKASSDSKAFISDLKAGRVNAITRYTEPMVTIAQTPEEKMMESILNDPIKADLLLRFAAAEKNGDTEVVATLAPIFATDNYEVSEELYLSLVAETTALIRARAKAMGVDAPVPGAHLGEDQQAPITDGGTMSLPAVAAAGPELIDLPDFAALVSPSDDPAEHKKKVQKLEDEWFLKHPDFIPRIFGKDPVTGEPNYGEKRTAIRVQYSNPNPLTDEERTQRNRNNHFPIPRYEADITKGTHQDPKEYV